MKKVLIILTVILASCSKGSDKKIQCPSNYLPIKESVVISRICFGSCADQNSNQPILTTAAQQNPDLFIFLGDNIYGDTEDMGVLRYKYNQLCGKNEFQLLQATCPILAVWDDHDYGANDAGLEYPKKEASKAIFMDFWGEENNSNRKSHEGIYDAHIFGSGQQALQVILLDNRTFRSAMNYQENFDPQATMLGSAQWEWLEQELLKPAKIRIIASSTQFGVEYNGFEAWANFPLEQEKMYDLIANTNANGVLFISGDIHYAELSKRLATNVYPLYDFTSSGITETYPPVANQYRVGNTVEENHIGMIDIDWNGDSSLIQFSVLDVNGVHKFNEEIYLNEIQF